MNCIIWSVRKCPINSSKFNQTPQIMDWFWSEYLVTKFCPQKKSDWMRNHNSASRFRHCVQISCTPSGCRDIATQKGPGGVELNSFDTEYQMLQGQSAFERCSTVCVAGRSLYRRERLTNNGLRSGNPAKRVSIAQSVQSGILSLVAGHTIWSGIH